MNILLTGSLVVIAGVAIFSLTRKKNSNNSNHARYCKLHPIRATEPSSVSSLHSVSKENLKAKVFLKKTITAYETELLPYCILTVAEDCGLNAAQRISLTERYGMVSLRPQLQASMPSLSKEDLRYEDIDNAARAWLRDNAVSCTGKPVEQVEQYLLEQNIRKAKIIIEKYKIEQQS